MIFVWNIAIFVYGYGRYGENEWNLQCVLKLYVHIQFRIWYSSCTGGDKCQVAKEESNPLAHNKKRKTFEKNMSFIPTWNAGRYVRILLLWRFALIYLQFWPTRHFLLIEFPVSKSENSFLVSVPCHQLLFPVRTYVQTPLLSPPRKPSLFVACLWQLCSSGKFLLAARLSHNQLHFSTWYQDQNGNIRSIILTQYRNISKSV